MNKDSLHFFKLGSAYHSWLIATELYESGISDANFELFSDSLKFSLDNNFAPGMATAGSASFEIKELGFTDGKQILERAAFFGDELANYKLSEFFYDTANGPQGGCIQYLQRSINRARSVKRYNYASPLHWSIVESAKKIMSEFIVEGHCGLPDLAEAGLLYADTINPQLLKEITDQYRDSAPDMVNYNIGICGLFEYCYIPNFDGLEYIKKAAGSGYPPAQSMYADFLTDGVFGNPVDTDKAEELYYESAVSGFARSQLNYGQIQRQKNNHDAAYEWFQKASYQGNETATHNLGVYEYERGNKGEAIEFYKRATTQGHLFSAYSLGCMYELGDGIDQDLILSHQFFECTAAYGLLEGMIKTAITSLEIGKHPEIAEYWINQREGYQPELGQFELEVKRRVDSAKNPQIFDVKTNISETPDQHSEVKFFKIFRSPLTMKFYVETWSQSVIVYIETYQPMIKVEAKRITQLSIDERNVELGTTILNLRHELSLSTEEVSKDNCLPLLINMDAHITYHCANEISESRLSDDEIVSTVTTYIQSNSVYEIYKAAEEQPEGSPVAAVGQDFVDAVITQILV